MNEEPVNSATPEENGSPHAIEEVARLTGFSRHTIAVFCQQGFIAPSGGDSGEDASWVFDDDAVRMLRHLAQLHHRHGLDLEGLRFVGPMLAELEILRTEVRFLRRRN